ncbi:uncharacterized protein LODBEIA_P21220 [Lodderomyces beijingensis]|uniref:Uncharacterized protein n=1 Tax=Lodderomyces beijingensis TaxID=1775926 RepID=A0ABP0ZIC3_9ASCO
MFKSQRFIILIVLSMFGILLVITSLAGHHTQVIDQAKSLLEYHTSNSGLFTSSSKSAIEKELAGETEEEEEEEKEVSAKEDVQIENSRG